MHLQSSLGLYKQSLSTYTTRLFQSARGTRAFGYLRTETKCVLMHDKSRFTQNFSVCMANLTGSTPAGLGEAFHAAFDCTCFV